MPMGGAPAIPAVRRDGALAPESEERARLATFYGQLAAAEGRHWELFRDLATELAEAERPADLVSRRLAAFADIEAAIIADHPLEARIH